MERPILFSTPMVQAIQDNRKRMTRRTRGLDEINKNPGQWEFVEMVGSSALFQNKGTGELRYIKCPYGQLRDTLWVRETWCKLWDLDSDDQIIEGTEKYYYKAGAGPSYGMFLKDDGTHTENCPWKPSIHMPREAARIFLTVKNVRVERLRDITEEDAKAEGVDNVEDPYWKPSYNDPDSGGSPTYKKSFEYLWDLINRKRGYGWDINPYVWVIEFERMV